MEHTFQKTSHLRAQVSILIYSVFQRKGTLFIFIAFQVWWFTANSLDSCTDCSSSSPVMLFCEAVSPLLHWSVSLFPHIDAPLSFLPKLKTLVEFLPPLRTPYAKPQLYAFPRVPCLTFFSLTSSQSYRARFCPVMFDLPFTITFKQFADLSSPVLPFAHWWCFLFCLCEKLSHRSSKPCVGEICCTLTIVPLFIWAAVMFSLCHVRASGCITGSHLQACVKCHFHVL